jgi:hypothetical protein
LSGPKTSIAITPKISSLVMLRSNGMATPPIWLPG